MAEANAPERDRRSLYLLDPEVARGLVARLRLTRLLGRFDERLVWAAFMLVDGFVTIAILAESLPSRSICLSSNWRWRC